MLLFLPPGTLFARINLLKFYVKAFIEAEMYICFNIIYFNQIRDTGRLLAKIHPWTFPQTIYTNIYTCRSFEPQCEKKKNISKFEILDNLRSDDVRNFNCSYFHTE